MNLMHLKDFFQLMEKIDWENNVISLFGKIPDLNFQKNYYHLILVSKILKMLI